MSPIDHEVLRRKLGVIQSAVLALQEAGPISLEQYRQDLWRRKGTERLLQEAIEAAVDVATHLLVRSGRPAPADAYSSFLDLAAAGVLSAELARAMAPSAGLRNRLVHEYDDLDDALVLRAVQEALTLLPRFVAEVDAGLTRRT